MNRFGGTVLGLVLAFALTSAGRADTGEPGLFGLWRNPKDTVHVEIRNCGPSACGVVVWASPKAQQAARKGSGKELVGLQILRDFARRGDDIWRGSVFVPDLNLTLSGTARLVDEDRLEAKGCLVGGLFCKSQVWYRLNGSPG